MVSVRNANSANVEEPALVITKSDIIIYFSIFGSKLKIVNI